MAVTMRSNTRITKSSTKKKQKLNNNKLPWHNKISRQSLRIAIQESLQSAQHHTGAEKVTTEPSVRTSVSWNIQPMRARPLLSEERRGAVNVPRQGTEVEIANRNGIESARKGWYYIRHIVAEVGKDDRHMYLVEWEGINPMTGTKWPNSWVSFLISRFLHDFTPSSHITSLPSSAHNDFQF